MSLAISDFHAAAINLKATEAVRLTEDGARVATSKWERFEVYFSDFFRDKKTIARKQTETLNAYLSAVGDEQGADMQRAADARIHNISLQGKIPLSAFLVRTSIELLTKAGGAHWLVNEQAIALAAHSALPEKSQEAPTLKSLLAPQLEALITQLEKHGTPKSETLALKARYALTTEGTNAPAIGIRDLSWRIETRLRDASKTVTKSGVVHLSKLTPEIIRQKSDQVIKAQFLRDGRELLCQQVEQEHPLTELLVANLGRASFDHTFSSRTAQAQVRSLISAALGDSPELPSQQSILASRIEVIDQLQRGANQIKAMIERSGKTSVSVAALQSGSLPLGKELQENCRACGISANHFETFVALSLSLYTSQNGGLVM